MTAPTPHASDPAPPSPPPHRRDVLQWLSLMLGGVAAVLVGIPFVGYILGALFHAKKDEWIVLGAVSDFPEGETRLAPFTNPIRQPWDGMAANNAAYVRRLSGTEFQVFAVNCTHLGCPVSWFPQSGLFMCPCHGGVYYENGAHASGPPPRGLYKYPYKVEDGRLSIRGGHLPTLQDTFEHPQDA